MDLREVANIEHLFGAPGHEYRWSCPERVAERAALGWEVVDCSRQIDGERFPQREGQIRNRGGAVLMRRRIAGPPRPAQPAPLGPEEAIP